MSKPREEVVACGAVCCCLIVITLIILFIMSFQRVDQEEYGVEYNTFKKNINSEIYSEGRYFLHPWVDMIKFNRIVVPIHFDNTFCITKDGIIISLNIVFNYKIKSESIINILQEFGTEHGLVSLIQTIADKSLRDSCSKFIASEFPEKRGIIEKSFKESIENGIDNANGYVDITFLQLENYDFPSGLNNAINWKQHALQDIQNALNERNGQLTVANTKLRVEDIKSQSKIIIADAEADSILLEAQSIADSTFEEWNNKRQVYSRVMNNTNATPEEFVEGYLKSEVIRLSNSPIIDF